MEVEEFSSHGGEERRGEEGSQSAGWQSTDRDAAYW